MEDNMYIVLLSHLGVVLDVFGACKKRLQLSDKRLC